MKTNKKTSRILALVGFLALGGVLYYLLVSDSLNLVRCRFVRCPVVASEEDLIKQVVLRDIEKTEGISESNINFTMDVRGNKATVETLFSWPSLTGGLCMSYTSELIKIGGIWIVTSSEVSAVC